MTARILVVDDIAANQRVLEARLTAEYFDVRTASNGREALDAAVLHLVVDGAIEPRSVDVGGCRYLVRPRG